VDSVGEWTQCLASFPGTKNTVREKVFGEINAGKKTKVATFFHHSFYFILFYILFYMYRRLKVFKFLLCKS